MSPKGMAVPAVVWGGRLGKEAAMRSHLAPKIRWLTGPPAAEPKEYRILSPKPGQSWEWLVLSDAVLGVETHYIGDRTQPCIGDVCICRKPDYPVAVRQKYYVAVWAGRDLPQAIGEITADAYKRCPELYQPGVSLRGLRIKVYRSGPKPNSRVRVHVVDRYKEPEKLPLPFDLVCALERIWFGNPRHGPEEGGAAQGVPVSGPQLFPPAGGTSHLAEGL
jgi:hypothetical protein